MMNGRWSLLAALVIVLLAAQAGAQRDIFIPGSKGEGSLDTDPVPKAGTVDRVFLMSGDRLSGRVSGISADGILTITNRSFKEPLQIRLKGVNRLTLADKGKILDGPDSVILTNGNRLRGAVEQITLDSIAVNTKAMGMVKIRRSVVAGIEFNIAGSIALDTDFTGGTAEPWQVRSGTWQVQNNRYYCMSSGGWAFVKTKQEGPMTFEWNITGTLNGYVTLSFFAKNASSYWGTDAVAIRLSRSYLYVYRVQNGSTRSVASKSFGVSGTSTKIRASYDPESGRLRLWVNNTDLGQYSINPPIKTGQYIHIYAQTPVAFDSIRVLRGAEGLGKSDKAHETDDQLVLANKDKVSGILESLSAGVAVVKTSYGKLDIKKERLLRVRFHTKSREVPRRRKEDIAVTFHDGAMLTLTVKKMDANQIDANAEFLGDIKILRRAVRSIQFNIYKKAGPTSMAPPAGGWRYAVGPISTAVRDHPVMMP